MKFINFRENLLKYSREKLLSRIEDKKKQQQQSLTSNNHHTFLPTNSFKFILQLH